jgi:preprotein translocase subunit SecG
MGFLLGLMTVILALDCVFLILLILIQLPKKEAGVGTAFGGAATDALFGAGTGNALTNMTKYAATLFFILALVLSIANASRVKNDAIRVKLAEQANASQRMALPSTAASNLLEKAVKPESNALSAPVVGGTNARKPLTNSPAPGTNQPLPLSTNQTVPPPK